MMSMMVVVRCVAKAVEVFQSLEVPATLIENLLIGLSIHSSASCSRPVGIVP
jgi:hypothetical protein